MRRDVIVLSVAIAGLIYALMSGCGPADDGRLRSLPDGLSDQERSDMLAADADRYYTLDHGAVERFAIAPPTLGCANGNIAMVSDPRDDPRPDYDWEFLQAHEHEIAWVADGAIIGARTWTRDPDGGMAINGYPDGYDRATHIRGRTRGVYQDRHPANDDRGFFLLGTGRFYAGPWSAWSDDVQCSWSE